MPAAAGGLFWQMMVSLDGFMAGPQRELDWHVVDADFNRYVMDMLASIDGMVLGRRTYELFAAYWPTAKNPEARLMNEVPKIVCSRTLQRVNWSGSRLLARDVPQEMARLKAGAGKPLALMGSADLAGTLLRAGLIDELRIFVAPVVLGAGLPMFGAGTPRTSFALATTQPLRSGVVLLTYRTAASG